VRRKSEEGEWLDHMSKASRDIMKRPYTQKRRRKERNVLDGGKKEGRLGQGVDPDQKKKREGKHTSIGFPGKIRF